MTRLSFINSSDHTFSTPSVFGDYFWKLGEDYKYSSDSIRVNETDSQHTIEVDLVGYNQKDLAIELDQDILLVTAKNDKRGETKYKLTLWHGANTSDMKAKMEDGVLSITIPKNDMQKKRKIVVD